MNCLLRYSTNRTDTLRHNEIRFERDQFFCIDGIERLFIEIGRLHSVIDFLGIQALLQDRLSNPRQ